MESSMGSATISSPAGAPRASGKARGSRGGSPMVTELRAASRRRPPDLLAARKGPGERGNSRREGRAPRVPVGGALVRIRRAEDRGFVERAADDPLEPDRQAAWDVKPHGSAQAGWPEKLKGPREPEQRRADVDPVVALPDLHLARSRPWPRSAWLGDRRGRRAGPGPRRPPRGPAPASPAVRARSAPPLTNTPARSRSNHVGLAVIAGAASGPTRLVIRVAPRRRRWPMRPRPRATPTCSSVTSSTRAPRLLERLESRLPRPPARPAPRRPGRTRARLRRAGP